LSNTSNRRPLMKRLSSRRAWYSFVIAAIAGLIGWLLLVTPGGGTSSASGRATQKPATHVDIDVMPGQAAKLIDLGSSDTIRVAVLAGSPIDVTTIDPATLTFAGAGVMKNRATAQSGSTSGTSDLKQGGGPKMQVTFEDTNGDGRADLVAKFAIPF